MLGKHWLRNLSPAPRSRENGGCRGWGWQVPGVLKEEIESSRSKVSELRWRALEESSCINITNLLWLHLPACTQDMGLYWHQTETMKGLCNDRGVCFFIDTSWSECPYGCKYPWWFPWCPADITLIRFSLKHFRPDWFQSLNYPRPSKVSSYREKSPEL